MGAKHSKQDHLQCTSMKLGLDAHSPLVAQFGQDASYAGLSMQGPCGPWSDAEGSTEALLGRVEAVGKAEAVGKEDGKADDGRLVGDNGMENDEVSTHSNFPPSTIDAPSTVRL